MSAMNNINKNKMATNRLVPVLPPQAFLDNIDEEERKQATQPKKPPAPSQTSMNMQTQ